MLTNRASAETHSTNAAHARTVWTNVLSTFTILGSIVLLVLAALLVALALPGKPSASSCMRSDGFIDLPRHGILSILDYLSLEGGHLYVASITHGTLFDITLDDAGGPDLAHVREMSGQGAAHGVALVSSQGIGYITRSKINRVDVFDSTTLKPVSQIPVSEDPDAILYVPKSHIVYVANGDAKLATLIDADKRVVSGTIRLGGKPEFVERDSKTGLLYQNL